MDADELDFGQRGADRRGLLKKIGVAGAVVWTAPLILSSAAHADSSATGTVTFTNIIDTCVPADPFGPSLGSHTYGVTVVRTGIYAGGAYVITGAIAKNGSPFGTFCAAGTPGGGPISYGTNASLLISDSTTIALEAFAGTCLSPGALLASTTSPACPSPPA